VKAVVIHAPGAPEQLVMADVPEPVPGPGEVLVDVAFAGCNWADTQIRTGIYPHARTYPLVLGLEIAGTVSKLGPGVTGVKIGERVAAFVEQGGAYAEKAVVAANMLMRLPDGIPFDVGAALTVQPLTGYHMLHTIYGIEPGESVLINAIGGGVGLFTTQLAVKAGARVIGTVGTPGKEKLALDYGAERVVVTRNEDFEQAVLDFTGGRGVDLANDSLGATMLDRPWCASSATSSASARPRASPSRTSASEFCRARRPLPGFTSAMWMPSRKPGRTASTTSRAASSMAG
jgi:NADPH:quinone reductase